MVKLSYTVANRFGLTLYKGDNLEAAKAMSRCNTIKVWRNSVYVGYYEYERVENTWYYSMI